MDNKQPEHSSDNHIPPEHWTDNLPWFLTRVITLGCIVMAVVSFVRH